MVEPARKEVASVGIIPQPSRETNVVHFETKRLYFRFALGPGSWQNDHGVCQCAANAILELASCACKGTNRFIRGLQLNSDVPVVGRSIDF